MYIYTEKLNLLKIVIIFVALTLGMVQKVEAQERYTLTNGSVLWFDGLESDDDATRSYPRGFDTISGGKAETHKFGHVHAITEITAKGTVFLALDTTGASSIAVVDSGSFSPLCVWSRTGSTGYYYQTWGQYRYYLVGGRDNLRVLKLGLTEPREQTSFWYDWDFGAAVEVASIREGVRTRQYYWITYDTIGTDATHGHWGMSCDSYERPETEVYNGFDADDLAASELNRSYYCARTLNGQPLPMGQGALFLPVKLVEHEKQIAAKPAGKGLSDVVLSQNVLSYGDETTVTPVIDVMDGGSPLRVNVVPAYTEYVEEVYRRGISTAWDVARDVDEFGRAGVPRVRHHYYYGSPVAKHATPPAADLEELEVDSVGYAIGNASRRYLQIDRSVSPVKMHCISVPTDGAEVRVLVTVYYHNGTRDTMSARLTMSAAVERQPMPTPTRGPVVHGMVVGGGRMADVGGNTLVTVHSCDSIGLVFGGNDIAGWVQGSEGARLQIGTEKTDADHPVRIGLVYGGGNGRYLYRGITSGVEADDDDVAVYPYTAGSKSLVRKSYWFEGEVYPYGYTPTNFGAVDTATVVWDRSQRVVDMHFSYNPAVGSVEGGSGRVPYLRKVKMNVGVEGDDGSHNDYIVIDTLFGGACNAYVGIAADASSAADTGINVRIHGGTLFAAFGGNNYGGAMAKVSLVSMNVLGTKLTTEKEIENTWFAGYGREFGIRHLYGGGNQVVSSVAHVAITGGMVDTCFLGGNAATVLEPVGTINCAGANFIFDNDSVKADFMNDWAALLDESPSHFRAGIGRYNVRVLFGGNNNAPMNNLSTINLLSGGISHCFGGGNRGDMRGSGALSASEQTTCFDGWEYAKPSALGSLVKSAIDSRVIVEKVFGGSRMANVRHSSMVWLRGGCFGNVYGGNDVSGDVGSETGAGTWVVVADNAIVLHNVYGGSNGQYHCNANGRYIDGEQLDDRFGDLYDPYDDYLGMLIPTHNNTSLYLHGGKVLGSAYGGGVMASVGFSEVSGNQIALSDSASVSGMVNGVSYNAGVRALRPTGGAKRGSVHFLMNGGYVGSDSHFGESHGDGNAYGGGYLSSIYGLAYLKVKGATTIKGSLYAGNDCMGQIENFGAYSLPDVASSNFKASDGVTMLNEQDEGGTWKALYSAYVLVTGTPRIGCVYGSGNGAYNYDGSRPEYSDWEPVCMREAENNRPRQSSTFIDINTSGGMIDTVFGGGNGVGVRDNVQVFFNSTNTSLLTVGTIFGGNNRDDMTCVPDIILASGKVKNVFGGGNSGAMLGVTDDLTDVCGRTVSGVSSYVRVDNVGVTITDTLFGGCRMADVSGMAYIDIRRTNAEDGINYVYGGNDISGTVRKNARIDVSGGLVKHIYGGSNGRYDYDLVGLSDYNVYRFRSTHNAANLVVEGVAGEPVVDSTTVNLYGGTIESNVYGGSSMADCRATYVEVNDQVCVTVPPLALNITGAVYGGGEGYWQDLNEPRRGNVKGSGSATHVHMRHAESLSGAMAYGGGRGGDVENTYLHVYPSWDQRFDALYGGCWGSDVIGTAHLEVNGDGSEDLNATNVFGGNDFTGNVYQSVVTIGSGSYQNIYGAGNGYYDEEYTSGVYAPANKNLYVPNNEHVEVNINDNEGTTTINGNVYGGGLQGTCMSYQKDANREYVTVNGRKVADTSSALTSASDYARIVINMHGGTIINNIYAGAAGVSHGNWLVYGLKQVNMDGGVVRESVYGGSENVNDGYINECDSTGYTRRGALGRAAFTATTLRPSSVLNITGGTVRGNVYGGGYLGNIYGSTYINVGHEAVDKCPLWTATINGEANAYASCKPEGMLSRELLVQHSVYGGANWGSGSKGADFSSLGVFGGETRIIVDGEGYNTRMDAEQMSLPLLTIGQSLLGSGTSASGGDVYNRIDLRNYGGIANNCMPTRTLRSIQRTDALWINETAIKYTGSTDAVSAYLSQDLSISRVDTLNAIGYNVIDVDAAITNVGEAKFYKHSEWPYDISVSNLVAADTPQPCAGDGCSVCEEERPSLCTQLSNMHRKGTPEWNNGTAAFTAFVVNSGINIDFIGSNSQYSPIYGYAYLLAEYGTNAVVTAKPKYTGMTEYEGKEYGGFLSVCSDSMMAISSRSGANGEVLTWCNCIYDGVTPYGEDEEGNRIAGNPCVRDEKSVAEYPYYNYSTQYRVWSIGHGVRKRYAVILAHSNPDTLYSINALGDTIRTNKKFTKQYRDTVYNFSLAHSVLALPPTIPGHYYKINAMSGISVTDENQEVNLIGMGYNPASWDALDNKWYIDNGCKRYAVGDRQEDAAHGLWDSVSGHASSVGVNYVYSNPGTYFGLVMKSGNNFEVRNGNLVRPKSVPAQDWKGFTAIEGNAHVEAFQNFSTAAVGAATNTQPELDLYLVYNNGFNRTLLGTVEFTLDEYVSEPQRDGNGDVVLDGGGDTIWIERNLGMPIEVEIKIQTLLQEFNDMEYDILAMYNEGRRNLSTRNVILPATLQHRELYLEGVEWAPTDTTTGNGEWITTTLSPEPDYFRLTSDSVSIVNPLASNNLFRMTLQPRENVTQTVNSMLGWHTRSLQEPLDLVSAVGKGVGSYVVSKGTYNSHDSLKVVSAVPYGIKIGELDGRSEASLFMGLNFDGSKIYNKIKNKGYLGKVVMTLASYTGGDYSSPNRFTLTLNVRTREQGDTIYVASASSITRGGITLNAHSGLLSTIGAGKFPSKYLNRMRDAFNPIVYSEGDVIAVLDTVKIQDGTQLFIRGYDYAPVQIIRYAGHNKEFPGERRVYRGPMFVVSGDRSSFTARSIEFSGSMVSKAADGGSSDDHFTASQRLYNAVKPSDVSKYADTNCVFGPIIEATNGGTVVLQNGVVVENNYNAYSGENSARYGALNVNTGGELAMVNNVTFRNNISASLPSRLTEGKTHPRNGAIYMAGGTVQLLESVAESAILVEDNYLSEASQYWRPVTTTVDASEKLVRYEFDTSAAKVDTYQKANVWLNRSPKIVGVTDVELRDSISNVITFESAIPVATRIGISKWFPDSNEVKRDTIRVAYQAGAAYLAEAVANNNFFSDVDGYFTLYSYGVNNQHIYLQRCATFRYQESGMPLALEGGQGTLEAGAPMSYMPLERATCPTGGDTIVSRLQGGFLPYTYQWSGAQVRNHTTTGINSEIMAQLRAGDTSGYIRAISDTMLSGAVNMTLHDNSSLLQYVLTANDATGNCPLTKTLSVNLRKRNSNDVFDRFELTGGSQWTDAEITADRNYPAVRITPMVWADRGQGVIAARVENLDTIYLEDEGGNYLISDLLFCEGDVIHLNTIPRNSRSRFLMWDFAPYYSRQVTYVVPAQNSQVVAYYGPNNYWIDTINNTVDAKVKYDDNYYYTSVPANANYVVTHSGDVHIYNEVGLAWFISAVNGLNGSQAHEYYANKVFLHKKSDDTPYDMKSYLWTPVGTRQHPFRGRLIGTGTDPIDTIPLDAGDYVVVKNIIVDEPNNDYVGFFGFIDTARVNGLNLEAAMMRGSQYVGTLAASSKDSRVENCAIDDADRDGNDIINTILTTRYASGGLVGVSSNDHLCNNVVHVKYVGNAVYSGGVVGYGTMTEINDNDVRYIERNGGVMHGLYIGGLAGYLEGAAPVRSLFQRAKSQGPSVVTNNYVDLRSSGSSKFVGGMVGYAKNTVIENNYVHGTTAATSSSNGVSAVLDDRSQADRNYFERSSASTAVGSQLAGSSAGVSASFSGAGNAVTLATPVGGVSNLTRVLNRWVREHNAMGEQHRTWRSDLEAVNQGYPLFGNPDTIPVTDNLTLYGCDSIEWDNRVYTESQAFSIHVIDPVEMIDSTLNLTFVVNHSTSEQYTDSLTAGEAYSGHGFTLTATETALLRSTLTNEGAATVVLSDTLSTSHGCDSVITLVLTFRPDNAPLPAVSEVKVYPNPTISTAVVEATGLRQVEVYENGGRLVMETTSNTAGQRVELQVGHLASGIYYLRIHTATGVTIQKLIKK